MNDIALCAGPITQFGTYSRETGRITIDDGFFLTASELTSVLHHAAGAKAGITRMVFPFFHDITQPLPGHYEEPVTIRWRETRQSEPQSFTSDDSRELEKVYAPLYWKYNEGKLAELEVKSE